jgi:NB-ARC domain
MAETVGTIAAVVGLVDVIIRAFGHVKSTVHASKELGDSVERILNICQVVKRIAEKGKTFNLPCTVFASVEENLNLVRKIAEKSERSTRRDRVQYMPKALSRLGKLEKVEQQMQTVLALITAIVAGKTSETTEHTVVLPEEQKHDLTQVLGRIYETSTQIDDAICRVENLHGPLGDLALDDKVDDFLRQRFNRLDESVAHLQGDVKAILHDALPTIQRILEDTRDSVTRRAVPVEPALQDCWVCYFSSVPAPSSYIVETQYVRNLKSVLLDETGQYRLVTVHICGGAGKTTACKMVANENNVRQRFKDGVIWVELGETASSGALIERLAHAVKRSGGERTAESILRLVNFDKFDLAKVEFQNWFDNR